MKIFTKFPILIHTTKLIENGQSYLIFEVILKTKWRPPNLSELTPMIFNTGLTHLSLEASKYTELIKIIIDNIKQ